MTLQSVTVRNEPGNSKEQTLHNGASKEKKCPKVNPYCDAIFDQSVTVRNEPGNGKEQTMHNGPSKELRKLWFAKSGQK